MDRMLETEGESGYALNVTLTSAARAIARNDAKLAKVLVARSPTIAQLVGVGPTKDVYLLDAEKFRSTVEEFKRAY